MRRRDRKALIRRCEEQHKAYMAGNDSGLYGGGYLDLEREIKRQFPQQPSRPTFQDKLVRYGFASEPSTENGWKYKTGVSRITGKAWSAWFPPEGSDSGVVWVDSPGKFKPGAQF